MVASGVSAMAVTRNQARTFAFLVMESDRCEWMIYLKVHSKQQFNIIELFKIQSSYFPKKYWSCSFLLTFVVVWITYNNCNYMPYYHLPSKEKQLNTYMLREVMLNPYSVYINQLPRRCSLYWTKWKSNDKRKPFISNSWLFS